MAEVDHLVLSSTSGHTAAAGLLGLFGLFAGMCAIFALVVAAVD